MRPEARAMSSPNALTRRSLLQGLAALGALQHVGNADAQALALQPLEAAPGIYVVIADLGPPSYANEGLNANLGFVVSRDGVGVIDSGPSARVAQALHDTICRVTKQPVRWVLNTNSQPNRWLGNAYFRRLGVPIFAHPAALETMRQSGSLQLETTRRLLRERAEGTEIALPDPLPADVGALSLADEPIQIRHLGPAHTAGDLVVWLPAKNVAYAGDIVYTDRLPAVLPVGSSKQWILTFDRLLALKPQTLIPGHGAIRPIAIASHHTRDYLEHLRSSLRAAAEAGEPFDKALAGVAIGDYDSLANFELLWRPNAYQVFVDLERDAFD
jgi:glyoxylase-like metal-dependent hydrolase (beta-lactamase superfamily II)